MVYHIHFIQTRTCSTTLLSLPYQSLQIRLLYGRRSGLYEPVRACNSADLAIYHCCVRKKMTEKAMQLKASRQFCGGVNSLSGFPFQSKSFGLRKWVLMHLDLMLAGLVDFFDFLWHALQVFCLSEQDALKFRILPDDIKSEYAKL